MGRNTYIPPVITVIPVGHEFVLHATNHQRTSIAGERILRAEPWPQIKFRHSDAASAEQDAATLRTYLAECASGKRRDRENAPRRKAWWED